MGWGGKWRRLWWAETTSCPRHQTRSQSGGRRGSSGSPWQPWSPRSSSTPCSEIKRPSMTIEMWIMQIGKYLYYWPQMWCWASWSWGQWWGPRRRTGGGRRPRRARWRAAWSYTESCSQVWVTLSFTNHNFSFLGTLLITLLMFLEICDCVIYICSLFWQFWW